VEANYQKLMRTSEKNEQALCHRGVKQDLGRKGDTPKKKKSGGAEQIKEDMTTK